MSEQPQDRPEGDSTAGDENDPPPAQDAPVAGGSDDGPPAQGEGAPDSW